MNRLDPKVIRTAAITAIGVFAVLCLISGIAFYLLTGPAPTDDWDVSWLMPSEDAAARLDEKIETLREDIESAASGNALVLEITEEEATSKLDKMARDGNLSLSIEYPQVYFSDGLARAEAQVHLVVDVDTAVQIEITARKGRADFTVRRLDLGRLGIPKPLINNVMTAMEHELGARWDELPVAINDIVIGPGVLTVTMVKK